LIKIICFKWKPVGETFRYRENYRAEHVNIFANMVDRNINIPYEIICFTDDPKDIDSHITTLPVWDDLKEYQMCYRRLKLFSNEMKDIIGSKFVAMDIDCIITGDITDIVNFKEDFKILSPSGRKTPYAGGMFGMVPGSRSFVWDEFKEKDLVWQEHKNNTYRYVHQPSYNKGFVVGSDQAYMSYKMWPNEATWTENDGVALTSNIKKGKVSYLDKKIIFTNGKDDPSHKDFQEKYPSITKHWC